MTSKLSISHEASNKLGDEVSDLKIQLTAATDQTTSLVNGKAMNTNTVPDLSLIVNGHLTFEHLTFEHLSS